MTEEKQGIQELLLNLLKEAKDDQGKDLYCHIKKVLTHLALTDPANALNKFEEVSCEIRKNGVVKIPDPCFNYKALSSSSQPWFRVLLEKYFEVISIYYK